MASPDNPLVPLLRILRQQIAERQQPNCNVTMPGTLKLCGVGNQASRVGGNLPIRDSAGFSGG